MASASDPPVRQGVHVGDAARVSEVLALGTSSAAALAPVVGAVVGAPSAHADAGRRMALAASGEPRDKRQTELVVCGMQKK